MLTCRKAKGIYHQQNCSMQLTKQFFRQKGYDNIIELGNEEQTMNKRKGNYMDKYKTFWFLKLCLTVRNCQS